MKNDKEQAIAACHMWQADTPTQARPIAKGMNPSTIEKPMDEIGTNLFNMVVKKWLATVDQYSGYDG